MSEANQRVSARIELPHRLRATSVHLPHRANVTVCGSSGSPGKLEVEYKGQTFNVSREYVKTD